MASIEVGDAIRRRRRRRDEDEAGDSGDAPRSWRGMLERRQRAVDPDNKPGRDDAVGVCCSIDSDVVERCAFDRTGEHFHDVGIDDNFDGPGRPGGQGRIYVVCRGVLGLPEGSCHV